MATPRRFNPPRRARLVALLLVALASQRGLVRAEESAPQQGAKEEPCSTCISTDEVRSGVYLRMSVGLSMLQLHSRYGVTSKVGGSASFALGYYILPNFALSVGVFGANAYKFEVPTKQMGTVEVDARSLGLGLSLTYYLPLEFYVAVTPGVGWVLETYQGGNSNLNNAGFALDVLLGKEWWIAGTWTLGASAQFTYSMADGRVAAIDYVWSLGVLFTVARN
jgi:hypothetical protein